MTSFQKNGTLLAGHVEKSFTLQLKNTWKETFGFIPTLTTALVAGNG